MNYIRLFIHYPEDRQELLIAELLDMDFEGFEQDDDLIIASIPQNRFDDTKRELIEGLLLTSGFDATISKEEIVEPTNWNKQWEDSVQPQYVGGYIVHPTWNTPDEIQNEIEIIINPKMAFGTGTHETTRLILEWLPELIEGGEHVLDAGTGTGILSIGAIKTGAKYCFGFDIDEWSKENAEENAELNGVEDQCLFELGSIEVIPEGEKYDIVLGNINRNALLSLVPSLYLHVKEEGYLVLSGLLEEDEALMLKETSKLGLKHIETRQKGEWIAILLHHESSH